jgi:hypothetical protein
MGVLQRIRQEITQPVLSRVDPLEGTNMSLWNSVIPNWWTAEGMNDIGKMFWPADGRLADRIWITSRCLQMNSQQIGSMPVRFEAPNVAPEYFREPAWVSNPDPAYYPNGIGSLLKALVHDYYAWGWALLYITSRYADGYPRNMTRIPAAKCTPRWDPDGYIEYDLGGELLDPQNVIQIDRDCDYSFGPHGTSAISSYAQMAWGLLAAGNQAMEVNTGGIPKVSLKVTDENRKMKAEQAEALQTQWQVRTQQRGGAPPVLPYGLDFQALSFNPKDMALLETQDFNALALATAFGIPAVLINMTVGGGRGNSALTYQTPAMVGDQWWRYELRPTAKGFADALSNVALPSGQWIWLDASDSLPPDNAQTGPFPTTEDDPQAAATAKDQQAVEPGTAQASPAQQSGAPRLTVAGGNR